MNIKTFLPEFLKDTIIKYINKQIYNYFKTDYKKKALLSYIVHPFKKDSMNHTNYYEATTWANILNELGYKVDIIHFDNCPTSLKLEEYDLICGFGDIFQKYFECTKGGRATTIYYATGMYVCHQNLATLKRVKDVYHKKGVWLGKSARFVEKTWTHQTTLVDGIIALGNAVCANSYKKYYDGVVLETPAPFYKVQNVEKIIINRERSANKHFLWFGSSGLVHKGLDLLLDYFSINKDITLHICGPVKNEPLFANIYRKELYETSNIITHDFVDIKSKKFADILTKCSFVIFPSCSEGGAASVLTAIGNGALIPIITKETTISTGFEIWIESLDFNGLDQAIKRATELSNEDIVRLQENNYKYVNSVHSQKNYYIELKKNIISIIGEYDEV